MFRRLAWVGWAGLLLPTFFLGWLFHLWETAVSSPPYDVIINEWSQGNGGSREWVELLVVNGPLDLRGWDLGDNSPGDLTFANHSLWEQVPSGSLIVLYNQADPDTPLPPDDFDLSDCVVVIPDEADLYVTGNLPAFANTNATDNPHLRDSSDVTVHNFSTDPGEALHPGANETTHYNHNTASGVSNPANWSISAATDATPGTGNGGQNSTWITSLCEGGGGETPLLADLVVQKEGPPTAVAGTLITYHLTLQNQGQITATHVQLTDTLPLGLGYISDNSGYPLTQPNPQQLNWQIGSVPTTTMIQFQLIATIQPTYTGLITNHLTTTTNYTESNEANNQATAVTWVQSGDIPHLLIESVAYYGYEASNDEAVRLRNVGSRTAFLDNWQLSDGTTTAYFPQNITILPGQAIWVANDSLAFARQFGFLPDVERTGDNPNIPDLIGSWPGFANDGDEVLLQDADGNFIDTVVYGDGNSSEIGWQGTTIQPYRDSGNQLAVAGQILYRQFNLHSGLPLTDTDSAADWAQTTTDAIEGGKVQYPGWDLYTFADTYRVTETAVLTIAIAPDNAFSTLVNRFNQAKQSIRIETHTFENVAVAEALIAAQMRGVSVTILLEGGPPGGLSNQEKYICQQLEMVGGQCWFMINDPDQDIYDRYRFVHAKFILIDDRWVIISSENMSLNSLPNDDKSDGTWGRRGAMLITDAPGVFTHLERVYNHDLDPDNHHDLFRWQSEHEVYGSPPMGFRPITLTGGITYTVRYSQPIAFQSEFAFEIVQSPENSLYHHTGLLGMVGQAGPGDTVLVQQLSERPFWGPDRINPRLEAYIQAARRGAKVRILLDAFFDDESAVNSNTATCQYINKTAQIERLRLECALGNPTGLGIHNKMVLVRAGETYHVHIGSLNGTELSQKGNREVIMQVKSADVYHFLADMFSQDWPYRLNLPLIYRHYLRPAPHVLISEVYYDSPGVDDAEFIELVNPTVYPIDLTGFSLGDAVKPEEFEDVRRFISGTIILPGQTVVVAVTASGFQAEFATLPDFEILDTDPTVPELLDDLDWGDPATFLQLGNTGDEVILRAGNGVIYDVLSYGDGLDLGSGVCPLVTIAHSSLERFPYGRDTNQCTNDFREWPFPSPGSVPQQE